MKACLGSFSHTAVMLPSSLKKMYPFSGLEKCCIFTSTPSLTFGLLHELMLPKIAFIELVFLCKPENCVSKEPAVTVS